MVNIGEYMFLQLKIHNLYFQFIRVSTCMLIWCYCNIAIHELPDEDDDSLAEDIPLPSKQEDTEAEVTEPKVSQDTEESTQALPLQIKPAG